MSAPSWLTVGAEVAIVQLSFGSVASSIPGKIVRIGKRDAVAADETGREYRFNMSSRTWRGDGLRSSSSYADGFELHALHSPESHTLRLTAEIAEAKRVAKLAVYRWERGETTAHSVARAFTDLANWEAGA